MRFEGTRAKGWNPAFSNEWVEKKTSEELNRRSQRRNHGVSVVLTEVQGWMNQPAIVVQTFMVPEPSNRMYCPNDAVDTITIHVPIPRTLSR